MRHAEALEIIRNVPPGFRVAFERRENGMLRSDYFPERDENPIPTETEAWNEARSFAAVAPKEYVNIYVIRCDDWTPVPGYAAKRLRTHPARAAQ